MDISKSVYMLIELRYLLSKPDLIFFRDILSAAGPQVLEQRPLAHELGDQEDLVPPVLVLDD